MLRVEAEILITKIQDLLGHTYIEITKIYTHINKGSRSISIDP